MPSISRWGFFSRIGLSLNVPGSPSSALQRRYFGVLGSLDANVHFIATGKPAPPRPLRPAFFTSSIISFGFLPRTLPRLLYPPTDIYSCMSAEFGFSIFFRRTFSIRLCIFLQDLHNVFFRQILIE